MFADIVAGMSLVFHLDNILAALFGVSTGMIVGAIPGFTDTMAMCLLIPFTFYLNPIAAIAMLMGLSKGGNFGGSIPAILFNVPGTPQAAVTAFDGYQLTKQGKSGKALKMALYASTMADTMSDFILFFLAAPVALIAIKIGPPEFAMIVLFSLVIIGAVACEDLLKGMIAIGIGLFFSVIGLDPQLGSPRFCFGSVELTAGLALVPMVIGILILSETFKQVEIGINKQTFKKEILNKIAKNSKIENNKVNFSEFKKCLPSIFGGLGIGSVMGIIPGIGTTVASYLSYTYAKKSSKNPERFGKGALEGVAAAEAGNNAVVGPNLIPLITLGIPGNLAAALILGAFMIQGLVPGPLFMQQYAPMLYALFIVLIISNLFTFVVGSIFLKLVKNLSNIPRQYLYPAVIVFGVIGAFVFRNTLFDVKAMIFLGVFGYVLAKFDLPLPPILVSFILGEILERKMRQSLLISRGNLSIFITHPIAFTFLLLTIAVVVFLGIKSKKRYKI